MHPGDLREAPRAVLVSATARFEDHDPRGVQHGGYGPQNAQANSTAEN
jgi:hypothetical protein